MTATFRCAGSIGSDRARRSSSEPARVRGETEELVFDLRQPSLGAARSPGAPGRTRRLSRSSPSVAPDPADVAVDQRDAGCRESRFRSTTFSASSIERSFTRPCSSACARCRREADVLLGPSPELRDLGFGRRKALLADPFGVGAGLLDDALGLGSSVGELCPVLPRPPARHQPRLLGALEVAADLVLASLQASSSASGTRTS